MAFRLLTLSEERDPEHSVGLIMAAMSEDLPRAGGRVLAAAFMAVASTAVAMADVGNRMYQVRNYSRIYKGGKYHVAEIFDSNST
jgi:hypothetical protein